MRNVPANGVRLFQALAALLLLFTGVPISRAYLLDASDLLGQVDGSGNPVWTTSLANNGAAGLNDEGFDFSGNHGNSVFVDTVDRRLFVADGWNYRVLVFNLDSENELVDRRADYVIGQADFASKDTTTVSASVLGATRGGLAYDYQSKRLFVTDASNSRVLVFDLSGGITNGMAASFVLGQADFTSNFYGDAASGLASANNTASPRGIVYDEERRRLFVSEYGNSRVLVFDLSNGISNGMAASYVLGQADFTSSDPTTSRNRLNNNPHGLAYDNERQWLFVADTSNNRIMVFDVASISNGEDAVHVLGQADFSTSVTDEFAASQNGLYAPRSMFYEEVSKTLIAGDFYNNRLLFFDAREIADGEDAVAVLGQEDFVSKNESTTRSSVFRAHSLFYEGKKGSLWLIDSGNKRVLLFGLPYLTTGTLSSPVLDQAYNASLSAAGGAGPYAYSLQEGTLPTGLTLGNDGTISGTPVQAGSFSFTVRVTDSAVTAPSTQGLVGAKQFTLTVAGASVPDNGNKNNNNNGDGGQNQQPADRIISNPNVEAMEAELAQGFIAVEGGNSKASPRATFKANYRIETKSAAVAIPKDTAMASQDGKPLDLTKLKSVLNGSTSAGNALGSLRFGIPSLDLSFSKPVTVTIPVNPAYDGKKVQVYYKKETEKKWRKETTCKIQGGKCVFQTDHATTFAVTQGKPLDKDSDVYRRYRDLKRRYDSDLNKERFFSVRYLRNTSEDAYFKLKSLYESFVGQKQDLDSLDPETQEKIRTYRGYVNYGDYVEHRNRVEGR